LWSSAIRSLEICSWDLPVLVYSALLRLSGGLRPLPSALNPSQTVFWKVEKDNFCKGVFHYNNFTYKRHWKATEL